MAQYPELVTGLVERYILADSSNFDFNYRICEVAIESDHEYLLKTLYELIMKIIPWFENGGRTDLNWLMS